MNGAKGLKYSGGIRMKFLRRITFLHLRKPGQVEVIILKRYLLQKAGMELARLFTAQGQQLLSKSEVGISGAIILI